MQTHDVGMETGTTCAQDKINKISSTRGRKWHKIAKNMANCLFEVFVFGLVLLATYASLQNGSLKTHPARMPQPFFAHNSPVQDFYTGSMKNMFAYSFASDLRFVMYYAPWDAVCMRARSEYDRAAKLKHDQVLFVAVNCWVSSGECHKQYPHVTSFPLYIAYPPLGNGIKYSGPHEAHHMIKFLKNLIMPYEVIHSPSQLLDLRAKYETVVVGFFDFNDSPQPPGFNTFYMTACRILEKDPFRDLIGFAVGTNRNIKKVLGHDEEVLVALYTWNSTHVYPPSQKFVSTNLVSWINKLHYQVLRWISPPKMKSLLISTVLENSSAMILFTPRNHIVDFVPLYRTLREVVLDYFNCNTSIEIKAAINHSKIQTQYWNRKLKELTVTCWKIYNDIIENQDSSCCQSYLEKAISNHIQCTCNVCIDDDKNIPSYLCHDLLLHTVGPVLIEHMRNVKSNSKICKHAFLDKSLTERFSMCCKRCKNSESCSLETTNSDNSKTNETKTCSSYFGNPTATEIAFAKEEGFISGGKENFSGLACQTNRTLSFLAIDSVQFGTFAENLGVELAASKQRTVAVILNPKQEIYHVLEDVTRKNLVDFIFNYTSQLLPRFLKSEKIPEMSCSKSNSACIIQLTAETFRETVLNNSVNVVVLYWTSWCGYCKGIYHIYLSAAQHFKENKNIIFARLNADTNDLPWEYSVQKYPSIILFPANRKSESVPYSHELPITRSNIVHFILSHVDVSSRGENLLSKCTGHCVANNRQKTLLYISRKLTHYRILKRRIRDLKFALRSKYATLEKLKNEGCKDDSCLSIEGKIIRWLKSLKSYRTDLIMQINKVKLSLKQAHDLHNLFSTKENINADQVWSIISEQPYSVSMKPREFIAKRRMPFTKDEL